MSYSQVNLLRGMDFKLRTSSSFTGTRNLADMYVKVLPTSLFCQLHSTEYYCSSDHIHLASWHLWSY